MDGATDLRGASRTRGATVLSHLVCALIVAAVGAAAQPIANSLTFRQQIVGDLAQGDWSDVYGSTATPTLSMTNFGLHGMDEGASVKLADGRVFIFGGDAIGAWFDVSTGKWLSNRSRNCSYGAGQSNAICLGMHPMILFNAAANHNACHHAENLKATIQGGSQQASICPTATVITDTSHTGQTPRLAWQNIANFQAGDVFGAGHPPTGVFAIGTALYALHQATTIDLTNLSLKTRTVLLKADQATSAITSTAAPTWTRQKVFTQAPTIPQLTVNATNGSAVVTRTSGTATDTAWTNTAVWEGIIIDGKWHVSGTRYTITNVSGNNITLNQTFSCTSCSGLQFIVMPKQDINTGKFAESSCELVTAAQMPAAVNSQLPAPLQGNDVLFCVGGSYAYRKSNLYLMAMKSDVTTLDAATYSNGLSNAYYLTGVSSGNPTWTLQAEDAAAPLFQNWDHVGTGFGLPCIGENSVRWHPLLQRWIATYGSAECGGIWARMSDGPKPWNWAREVRVLVNHNQSTGANSWHAGLIHSPSNDNANFTLTPPVYDPDTVSPYTQFTSVSPWNLPGNAYGPYQLPADSDVQSGNIVTMFTLVSGFNPYVVWVASFDVQRQTYSGLTGRAVLTGRATI